MSNHITKTDEFDELLVEPTTPKVTSTKKTKVDPLTVPTPITLLKSYATCFGSPYTFMYNNKLVSLNFDGKVHVFPKYLADAIQKKLDKAMDANAPENRVEETVG